MDFPPERAGFLLIAGTEWSLGHSTALFCTQWISVAAMRKRQQALGLAYFFQ